jgi:signal transduction histidine kinase
LTPQILLQHCGLTNITFLRLRRGQELIGFLACGYREPKNTTSRHTRIAGGIANIASLALANAKLLEDLDRANRIKEDFMGAMSHELRTPLNVIIGYTQLMEEETFGPLSTEQSNILRRIGRNTNELLDLISATLDLGRLQNQQRAPLHIQTIEGASLLAELKQTLCQFQHKSTVSLHWKIREPLPSIQSDAAKLKMVLKNLIANAMKFTDTGAITVSAEPQHDGIAFSVTDTGIGIAHEALPSFLSLSAK